MTRIGIILGSTRPGRNGEQVAQWVLEHASRRPDATFEIVDLLHYPLPPTSTSPCHRPTASTRTSTPRRGRPRSARSTASSW
ncbi:NADPH-dependent FMN reductase [Nonomuraea salmonea]|uniref:NADPH-dependent FMN reductase n=1 Tax=Nonomuraea salmonea TaxID=46181 RepID=UPI0031E69056